jgi:Heavy metal associated domain 2
MRAVHVAHDIPGRLRLRLPAGASTEGLQAAVSAVPGVTRTTWSARTRSLLVLYDPDHGSREAIAGAVTHASGLPAAVASDTPSAAPAPPGEPGAALALGVRQLFGEVDHRVQRATRGLVGLGGLFPVALTAWALTEVVRGRAAPLAWSSALWYAHGLFRDYQVPVKPD